MGFEDGLLFGMASGLNEYSQEFMFLCRVSMVPPKKYHPPLYLYPCLPAFHQDNRTTTHPMIKREALDIVSVYIYIIYISMFIQLGALHKIGMLLDEFIFGLGCSIKAKQHRPKGQETNISSPTQAAAGFIIFQISVCTRQP